MRHFKPWPSESLWWGFPILHIPVSAWVWIRASIASNLIPHSSQIPPFYTIALREFRDFVYVYPIIPLEALQARDVYSLLLSVRWARPSICEQQENGLVDFGACWQNVQSWGTWAGGWHTTSFPWTQSFTGRTGYWLIDAYFVTEMLRINSISFYSVVFRDCWVW
jgi:hypothetical protein